MRIWCRSSNLFGRAQQFAFRAHDAKFLGGDFDALGERANIIAAMYGLDPMLGPQVELRAPSRSCKIATKCSHAIYGDTTVHPAQLARVGPVLAEAVEVETGRSIIPEDQADAHGGVRTAYEPKALGRDVVVYRISGAFSVRQLPSAPCSIASASTRKSSCSSFSMFRLSTARRQRHSKGSLKGSLTMAPTFISREPENW